ncbi:MAG: gliding motility-associated C-terminal domain-containing protein, partial [Vicingaceae bacterium]
LIDLKIDQQQNTILTGHFILNGGDRNIFLMSISSDGDLNYFKVFNTGTADIVYSLDINPQNEILLYFKTNIGQAGPNNENTLAKVSASGQTIWIKEYGYTVTWGQMCATSDGGALISDVRNLVKIDNLGNVSWNKTFEQNYYSQDHFEIPGGYVFFRYNTSSLNRSYAIMLNKNGSLKWNSQLILNFFPYRGILRKNGNLLFAGDFALQATMNNPTFIEVDTSNGDILRTYIHQENIPLITISDLNELSNGSIFFSGYESSSFPGGFFISKVNDTLARISCKDTSISLNFPRDTGITNAANAWTAQSTSIPLIEPKLNVDTFIITKNQVLCEYTEPMILDLGEDTTLCPRDSLTLAASTNFEGYNWSNGQNTPSIKIGQAGTYWLKAWLNCDTIADTITIDYHQLPELNFGSDTVVCLGSSVLLSTNNGEIAYWSTGDTATSITVDLAGKYWADIPTVCGFISDTIELKHHPELQQPRFGDTSICINTHLQLSIDPNATYVLWSTGENSHQIQTDTAGVYDVTIANACDTLKDTFQLSFHPKPNFIPTLSKDTAKVLDSVFFQLLSPKNFQSLQWDFGDGGRSTQTNPIHQYKNSGWMHPKITLVDSLGCTSDSSLRIYIQALNFHIPNVFTPNGDGINDLFEVYGKGIKEMQIKIYNRWGDLIYASENAAWDGRTLGGKAASEGTYLYVIRFTQSGNAEETVKGTVNLIRSKKGNSSEQEY